MAPPSSKYSSRPRPALQAAKSQPRRRPTVELPFDDGEVLNADDPRPQRVPQYPSEARRVGSSRRQEEAIPTTVYEIGQDEELPPTYDPKELSDPGFKPAFLYVEKGPGQGQLVQVKQGSLVIGRASISDLRLQHPSVSRRHAQVTRLGERFYLKDLGSQNATYVNKVRIETEIEVYPGDLLQIGSALLKLRGPAEKVPEAAKKQIDKAAAKSARRKAVVHEPTEPKARPLPSAGPNKVLLGIACAAIGFGLAAVALFVMLNLTQPKPQFEVLASPPEVQVTAAEPEVELAPEALAPAPAQADPVAERIAREMAAKKAAAAAAEATPEPIEVAAPTPPRREREEVSATRIARRERVAPRRSAPKKVAHAASQASNDEDDDWADEVAPKKSGGNGEALKLYEAGNVSAAIGAAKDNGDDDLAGKLSDFQSAYAAGQKAERSGDGAGAVRNYLKALSVDEKISGGWGKNAAAINKKLGNIYVVWGQQLLKEDDSDGAQKAFGLALKYDPANKMAKKYLATRPAAAKKARREATKSAIEDAWED